MKAEDKSDQKNSYELKSQQIFCINKSESYLLCTNDQCTKYPFLCGNQQCSCHSQHPKCLKSTKKSLMIALQDKLVSYRNIEKKIKDQIQKAIDQLSQFETLLLSQCQAKFTEFVGLTDFEKEFMKAIKLGKVDNITGKTIWTIQLNLKKSQKVTKMLKKLQQDINNTWNQFENDLKKMHQDIKDRLQFFGSEMFQDSKVIRSRKQGKIIEGFFESQQQKIKSVKLLFRGSEKNFSSAEFHNVCNGQTQTITICENTFGKKIGGYTPLGWHSSGSYSTDGTGKTFVFSLTNNHKFVAETQTNNIYGHSSYGPTFGDGHDFYLAEGCNNNFSSYSNVNYRHKNPNYTQGSQASYTLMTGGQQNYNFKVKQYEVWKVQFDT